MVYAVVATAWLAATWNRSEEGLYPLAGAVLAPVGMALMLPAALLPVRRAVWRAVFGAAGVLLAGIVAGLSGATLPLSSREPSALALQGSEAPGTVARALGDALTARPRASCSPPLRSLRSRRSCRSAAERGVWAVAGLGAAAIALLLLPVEAVNAVPVIAGIWLCCVGVSVRAELLRR